MFGRIHDLDSFIAAATRSDVFAGGLALGAIGIAMGLARALWIGASDGIARRLSVSVTLDSRLPEFAAMVDWLDDAGAFRRARRLRVVWTERSRGDGAARLAPEPGTHWIAVGGRPVRITRTAPGSRTRTGPASEMLTLTVPFGRRATINGWIDAAREAARVRATARPRLHVHVDGYWSDMGPFVERPVATLVADDDRIARLVDDLRRFLASRDWYVARGVPWRRGYLLHGPPGTGKSSAIRAVATELGVGIGTLDLGRASLTDDELTTALSTGPDRVIYAFEDIDAVFSGRAAGDGAPGGISFSGLLNALDGVAAQEGRAIFMTTNHPDRLDPALIRPGRADVHVELGLVGAGAARALFLRFFPGE